MMRSQRFALSLVCVVLLTSAVVPALGEELMLSEVPAYDWTHGCSPTAGMMIMGYWDAYGYSALIPGSNSWSSNKSAIQDAIASPEHVTDYALYNGVNDENYSSPYTDKSELGGAHSNNCLADFMRTSFSSEGLTYGSTGTNRIGPGMEAYASWRGYSFTAGGDYSSMPTWADFTKEIKFGRSVMFSVDTNSDGETDHSVTAIGFRDTNGYQEYACRDTWSTSSTPRWERFRPVSASYNWGVDGMDTFRPTGTQDTKWNPGNGDWNSSGNWDSGVPDANTFVYVPEDGMPTVSGGANSAFLLNNAGIINIQGTFSARAIRNYGTITQASGAVNVSQDLMVKGCQIGQHAWYKQSEGTVHTPSLTLNGQYDQGAYGYGIYRLSGGRLEVPEGIFIGGAGRFEWAGGTIQTPKITIGGRLAMVHDFNLADLVSGAMFDGGGSIEIPSGGTVMVSGGAWGTLDSGSVNLKRLTIGDEFGTGNFLLSGSGELVSCRFIVNLGLVRQTGGRVSNYSDGIYVGNDGGSSGTYKIEDGEILVGKLQVGQWQGSTGVFRQTGGKVQAKNFYMATHESAQGTYELEDGELLIEQYDWIGNDPNCVDFYPTSALFVQTGGIHKVWYNSSRYGAMYLDGTYRLEAGELIGRYQYVGYRGYGTVIQSGGQSEWLGISLSGNDGGSYTLCNRYEISGGVLATGVLNIGRYGRGALDITSNATSITISKRLYFGAYGSVTAVPGAVIHMTGSAFENQSTNPDNLVGLGNLTLIFEGGSEDIDPFEVAGEDMGAVLTGLESNFALGTLQLGGADVGQIQLIDTFDNQPDWVGSEVLYVKNLILEAGSTLDLNGLNLYYYTGEIGGAVSGGALVQIDWIKGDANLDVKVDDSDLSLLLSSFGQSGKLWGDGDFNDDGLVDDSDLSILLANFGATSEGSPVPEPATLLILAAAVPVLLRRRQRS